MKRLEFAFRCQLLKSESTWERLTLPLNIFAMLWRRSINPIMETCGGTINERLNKLEYELGVIEDMIHHLVLSQHNEQGRRKLINPFQYINANPPNVRLRLHNFLIDYRKEKGLFHQTGESCDEVEMFLQDVRHSNAIDTSCTRGIYGGEDECVNDLRRGRTPLEESQ